ncbi:hypothetical protein [Aurantimonas sp. VKM B-3413]|uniref:hypothetical protein n=1 Tax=Aurantimonas sp. VKM B-3413 TaxID=2779401 RepID=UPI001E615848|nr:hypothetical protein [Aurantimonas sp. VKM B-3413]MCB8839172.1 hypothetical protein [Aurantimonas sp. VKM B-3413]
MGTVLRFLFVIPIGYIAACLTAAFALLWPFIAFTPASLSDPVFLLHAGFVFTAQAVQVGAVAIVPWLVFMVMTEFLALPSVLLHVTAGLIGGVAILFVAYGSNVPHMSVQTAIIVASISFALVYWIVAGHGAGGWRRRRVEEAAAPQGSSGRPAP